MKRGPTIKTMVGIAALAIAVHALAGPGDDSAKDDKADGVPALDARALAELELEHSRARDQLLAAEARLALLAEKLYASRLVVHYRGNLDTPFQLALVEMRLDGTLAYRKEFERAPTAQALKLFDGHLPPGRHVVEVRIQARGPGDPDKGLPGYSAASGMAVHLREGALTRAEFEADQDGDAADSGDLKGDEPDGSWEVEIDSQYSTEKE